MGHAPAILFLRQVSLMIVDSVDHINDDKDVGGGGGLRKTFYMGKMHKLLQTCKQVATSSKTVVKLCSHCLFQVLGKSLVQAISNFRQA